MKALDLVDFISTPMDRPQFLVEPYVATQGITFLHGKTNIGKSPVTWALCHAIATGTPFFGRHVRQGRVLYIDRETPALLVHPRLKRLQSVERGWFYVVFPERPLNLIGDGKTLMLPPSPLELIRLEETIKPDFVVWCSLRYFVRRTLNDDSVVVPFYDAIRQAFPGAAHLVSSHDNKTPHEDSTRPVAENYQGAGGWSYLAQVSLQLREDDDAIELHQTRSQVYEQEVEPLRLFLHKDGTTLEEDLSRARRTPEAIADLMEKALGSRQQRVASVCQELGMSPATVYRYLKKLRGGTKP